MNSQKFKLIGGPCDGREVQLSSASHREILITFGPSTVNPLMTEPPTKQDIPFTGMCRALYQKTRVPFTYQFVRIYVYD